ncbi:MAG: crossover junction endodeoxyribonuclease RuvC [Balneolales bacterium]|nr:crossover junction endodeoxyribonuclease RuvC [Balneolales bacterium]
MHKDSDIILGVDPGSRKTGFAILIRQEVRYSVAELGVIRAGHLEDHSARLHLIYSEIGELIKRHKPSLCAIETPVYGKDPLAMLKLGRAQAACILAISLAGLPVAEYYPKAVKKSITGNGNASKEQVAYMLEKLLGIEAVNISNDATDALAVAWCHSMRKDDVSAQNPLKRQGRGRTAWGSFIQDNPDRVKGGK